MERTQHQESMFLLNAESNTVNAKETPLPNPKSTPSKNNAAGTIQAKREMYLRYQKRRKNHRSSDAQVNRSLRRIKSNILTSFNLFGKNDLHGLTSSLSQRQHQRARKVTRMWTSNLHRLQHRAQARVKFSETHLQKKSNLITKQQTQHRKTLQISKISTVF